MPKTLMAAALAAVATRDEPDGSLHRDALNDLELAIDAEREKGRRRVARMRARRKEQPIVEVVGNGDGTMNVLLADGSSRRLTEKQYLAWPRGKGTENDAAHG